ncbi:bifunctional 4-hydroxy-2-oxoglutarate aldolase/2-dehydro-3-deoxy-phosphogluconate aldolase [Arthrobacter sp. KN11-1C]|uniref:bifunctional 4-hydroxy-2-oxoglutarate aldolase/2-dehydro-3-deoxy-phosphogluconate aldolase n=1 Tax=Arthrobacter sp. KN11-1C TaxID=3445774 RepID=UPI003FA0BE2F
MTTPVLTVLKEDRVAAVIRAKSVDDPVRLVRTLSGEGIRCVEFTFTIPSAAEIIREVASEASAVVGAGTILTADQAREAISAGAKFVVSPGLVPAVAAVCNEHDIPFFPGALSPTEVYNAHSMGAAAIKIFPANTAGPRYLRDLLGPFPHLALVPSGGVTPENALAFLQAGAVAVFAGSDLVPSLSAEQGAYELVRSGAKRFRDALSIQVG